MIRSSRTVAINDLVGRDYEAGAYDASRGPLDCLGASCAVLGRLGMAEAASDLIEPWGPAPDPEPRGWSRVQGPLALGDIILSESESGWGVAAVCGLDPVLALTSIDGSGVMCLPARRIARQVGTYRWVGK